MEDIGSVSVTADMGGPELSKKSIDIRQAAARW